MALSRVEQGRQNRQFLRLNAASSMDKKHQPDGTMLDKCWCCAGAAAVGQPISWIRRVAQDKKKRAQTGGRLALLLLAAIAPTIEAEYGRLQSTPQT
jgi:hypothetical protein